MKKIVVVAFAVLVVAVLAVPAYARYEECDTPPGKPEPIEYVKRVGSYVQTESEPWPEPNPYIPPVTPPPPVPIWKLYRAAMLKHYGRMP